MQEFDLPHVIHQSERLSILLHETLGTEAQLDPRGKLAIAYLSLSLAHREAILLLVKFGAAASATALQRPLLEAFVTGAWIESGATDAELKGIAALDPKASRPKFETMVQRLRETHDLGEWFETFRGHYKILGDYAHGYTRQLSRWLSPEAVEPRYVDGQLVEVLRHSDLVGVLAAIHRERIAKRPYSLWLEVLDAIMYRRDYPKTEGQ